MSAIVRRFLLIRLMQFWVIDLLAVACSQEECVVDAWYDNENFMYAASRHCEAAAEAIKRL